MCNVASASLRLRLLGGAAALALLHPGLASAGTVGTAGAANVRSIGTPPGGSLRVIEIGTQVVSNEKIETSASGSVQLLFIDKTTLSVGPNSTVVIDKFVFNPATAQGEMVLTVGKGVLRVVGGQATHTGGATITTPIATIGLRGGIVTVSHYPGTCTGADVASAVQHCGTQGLLGFGLMTVTAGGVTQQATQPGFAIRATSASEAPSTPFKATAAQVDQSLASATSKGGQSGGSSVKPTDQQAAANNVGTPNSVDRPGCPKSAYLIEFCRFLSSTDAGPVRREWVVVEAGLRLSRAPCSYGISRPLRSNWTRRGTSSCMGSMGLRS